MSICVVFFCFFFNDTATTEIYTLSLHDALPIFPPPPGQPQPPRGSIDPKVVVDKTVAILEEPPYLPARCVVLDEFLAPTELEELTRFTLEHEGDFSASEVVSPTTDGGVVNYEHRRSRVLMDLAQYQDLVLDRVKA